MDDALILAAFASGIALFAVLLAVIGLATARDTRRRARIADIESTRTQAEQAAELRELHSALKSTTDASCTERRDLRILENRINVLSRNLDALSRENLQRQPLAEPQWNPLAEQAERIERDRIVHGPAIEQIVSAAGHTVASGTFDIQLDPTSDGINAASYDQQAADAA